MKKYLALALGVIFTLGFAAIVFADEHAATVPANMESVYAGGKMRIAGNYVWTHQYTYLADMNNSTQLEKANNNVSYPYAAVRLYLDTQIDKNTLAHLSFVMNGDYYTVGGQGTNLFLGEPGALGKGGQTKKGPPVVRRAYIQHTNNLLGFPTSIRIGHQDLSLGTGTFFRHASPGDDGIRIFATPAKDWYTELMIVKLIEGVTSANDDTNFYSAYLAYKGKDFNVSGDYGYWVSATNGVNTNGAIVTNLAAGDHGTTVNNFGLRGDATFGALNVTAEANLQTGKTDYETNPIRVKGRNYQLGVKYTLNPMTNLAFNYGYASGDDNSADNDNDVYLNTRGAGEGALDATIVYGATNNVATGIKGTSLGSNTVYGSAGVFHKLTKDVGVSAVYFILRSAELNSSAAVMGMTTHLSKKIGTELDAKLTWQITKNLDYLCAVGYLWTGKFYDTATVSTANPYNIRNELSLNF